MDGLHLQARLDNSHGRGAKYASNVNEPGFRGCLFFNLSCYWFFGPVVALGSGLLYMADTCCSTTVVVYCVSCATSSSMVGAGLRLLSVSSPTVSQSSASP
jgi:hypothetical protein